MMITHTKQRKKRVAKMTKKKKQRLLINKYTRDFDFTSAFNWRLYFTFSNFSNVFVVVAVDVVVVLARSNATDRVIQWNIQNYNTTCDEDDFGASTDSDVVHAQHTDTDTQSDSVELVGLMVSANGTQCVTHRWQLVQFVWWITTDTHTHPNSDSISSSVFVFSQEQKIPSKFLCVKLLYISSYTTQLSSELGSVYCRVCIWF